MTPEQTSDLLRDANLKTVAALAPVPVRPSAADLVRWRASAQHAVVPASHVGRSAHWRIAGWASGAAAAVLAAAFWVSFGQTNAALAGEILTRFSCSLSRGLTIRLHNIDLENVVVHGEVLVQRGTSEGPDLIYSELHARLRADNPKWADFPALSVLCTRADAPWAFTQGNGVMILEEEARPFSTLHTGQTALEQYALYGLLQLGAAGGVGVDIPAKGKANFHFLQQQRKYLRLLLQYLIDQTECSSAAEVARSLQAAAGALDVQKDQDGSLRLTARRLDPQRLIPALDLPYPNVEAILAGAEVGFGFFANGTGNVQPAGRWSKYDGCESGVAVINDVAAVAAAPEGGWTPDNLAAALRTKASDVRLDSDWPPGIAVLVRGYPWELDWTEYNWAKSAMSQLASQLELVVIYDPVLAVVRSATFRNVGPRGGEMVVTPGEVLIPVGKLDPEVWTRDVSPELLHRN